MKTEASFNTHTFKNMLSQYYSCLPELLLFLYAVYTDKCITGQECDKAFPFFIYFNLYEY